MLSQYTTSEADMFSAHLIHNVGIEVLKSPPFSDQSASWEDQHF